MVRKKDDFWEYGEELNGRFKCKFCEKDFPGGIARLKSHLSGVTGRDVAVCISVPEEVQARAIIAIGGSNKKSRMESSGTNHLGSVIGSSGTGGTQQQTLVEMCAKKNKSVVDKKVTKCFVMNNITFNVIQSQSFVDMVKAIADFGIGYVPPSYSALRTKLIPEEKKDVVAYVEKVKKSWEETGCTIMSDIWTDLKDRSFINVIAYSLGGAVFLNSYEFSKDKKTSSYLCNIISTVMEEIGPQNVVQFITDNASNYDVAGNMLMGKYPHMYKTNCAAHGLQLLLKDIPLKVEWIRNVFADAKSIVDFMYKHTVVLSLMRNFTEGKELKSPCKTRFASHFLMVQSILEVENGLRLLVASQEWRRMEYTKSSAALNVTNVIQKDLFWKEATEVVEALEPLVIVLRLVDGDGSTCGYLYDTMERARSLLELRCKSNEAKYKTILEIFDYRKHRNIVFDIHAVAALLNPSYMFSENFKEDDKMREGMNYIFDKLVPQSEKIQFLEDIATYRTKSTKLFNPFATMMMQTVHPRVWWQLNGHILPVLQRIAIRILSQPCSSSACERNWSAWEAAQTKKRNKLASDML